MHAPLPSDGAGLPLGLHRAAVDGGRVIPLAQARRGDRGVVVGVGVGCHAPHLHGLVDGHGVHQEELERRLLEIGFVEGAEVAVLHEGLFGRDPLAVRVDDTRVALRRREAADILLQLHG